MSDTHQKELHLLDYWKVLVKQRWVVYTSIVVVVATVTLGSLLKRPVYTATTRLQIERNMPKILPFQDVMSSIPDSRDDFHQTQYGLIQSRRVAGDVIASLDLARHEEFFVKSPHEMLPGVTEESFLLAERIDLLLGHLDVNPVRKSRLVDVSFRSHDPALAARIANRVAETYIAFNSSVQYNTTIRATTTLTHQIANLQEQIDLKEKEVQAYARENEIVELGDRQSIALKELEDLSDSYTASRADRIEKKAKTVALQSYGPESVPEVLNSQLIRELTAESAELGRRYAQLSEKYKQDWPEMARLRREIDQTRNRLSIEKEAIHGQVLAVSRSDLMAAREREKHLQQTLEAQKQRVQDLEIKAIHYNNLRAEIANKRSTIEALLKRQAETGSSIGLHDLAVSNIRIVDVAAVPTRRSSPKILKNILLSLITSLVLGIGLAFFFEYMDKSIKSIEEIREAAGVPVVGLIPALRPEGSGLRVIRPGGDKGAQAVPVEVVAHEDPKSTLAEAFREMRTTLLVSQSGGPPRQILITSAQPGEGKTALAANLAITLAQIGRRVVLVDGDMRRSRMHKIFRVSNAEGLSNYLSFAGRPWPVPKRTAVTGLDVIPSGPLPPNPADLLDSECFAQMQRELQEQGYDHVIFDSPPVLAVADPSIMAGRMDAVVMVVRAGCTPRDALAHAVKKLQQVRARVIGAVMNCVDAQAQGYYDSYYYTKVYGNREEAAGAAVRRRRKRSAQSVT